MNHEILDRYIARVSSLPIKKGFRLGVRSQPTTRSEWEACLRGSCYHEAGHAFTKPLMAVHQGADGASPIEYVTVLNGQPGVDDSLGPTKVLGAGTKWTSTDPLAIEKGSAVVRFLLAGPIAEHCASKQGLCRTAIFDRVQDVEWEEAKSRVVSGFKSVVRSMDDYIRDNWSTVERIAGALMEKGRIDGGAELDALIGEEIHVCFYQDDAA